MSDGLASRLRADYQRRAYGAQVQLERQRTEQLQLQQQEEERRQREKEVRGQQEEQAAADRIAAVRKGQLTRREAAARQAERELDELEDEVEEAPDPVMLEVLAPLRSEDAPTRLAALEELRELTMCAVGEEGAMLGQAMRGAGVPTCGARTPDPPDHRIWSAHLGELIGTGGVALLAWLLVDPDSTVQQEGQLVEHAVRPVCRVSAPHPPPWTISGGSYAPRSAASAA